MASEAEPDLRNQLIEARADIIAQLDELHDRAMGIGRTFRDAPPDYASEIAALEGQLREIDALLNIKDASDA